MGVFEFIVLMVLISTIGKVLMTRSERPAIRDGMRPDDVNLLNEAMSDMNTRLAKLEEERDFYRALLEPPTPNRPGIPAEAEAPARPRPDGPTPG
jgi:hypothetical protein